MINNHPGYYHLGRILRTHGITGDTVVYLDTDEMHRYQRMKKLFIQQNNQLTEVNVTKVTGIKLHEHTAIIHLEGFSSVEDVSRFLKCDVYLPLSDLPKLKGKKFYFHEIIGYKIIDEKNGELGFISEVYDLPQHPVGEYKVSDKSVLFPLSETFIVKLDRPGKTIYVDLPNGLADVYLK